MPSAGLQWPEKFSVIRPQCPDCLVPMQLMKIERHESGNPRLSLEHFGCMACTAVAILPPLFD